MPPAAEVLNENVLISVQQAEIVIHSPIELLDKVVVYNAIGRKIFQKKKIFAQDFVVSNFGFKHQVLIVSVLLSNDRKINRKIMY